MGRLHTLFAIAAVIGAGSLAAAAHAQDRGHDSHIGRGSGEDRDEKGSRKGHRVGGSSVVPESNGLVLFAAAGLGCAGCAGLRQRFAAKPQG